MNKIEAIEKTIYNLENNVYEYDWTETNKCNCGILARSIMDGKNPTECGLREAPMASGYEAFTSYATCMTTGIKLHVVFAELQNAGFSFNDVYNLENLVDKIVLKKMGRSADFQPKETRIGMKHDVNYHRAQKDYLVTYLKAWASILKEEEPNPKVIHIYHAVEVPATIKDETKKLILN